MINEAALEDLVQDTKIFCRCGHSIADHHGCEMFCGKCDCISFNQTDAKNKPEDWPEPEAFAKDLPVLETINYCPKCNHDNIKLKFIPEYYSWQYPGSIEKFEEWKKSYLHRSYQPKWSDNQANNVCGEHLQATCARCEYFVGSFKCADAK